MKQNGCRSSPHTCAAPRGERWRTSPPCTGDSFSLKIPDPASVCACVQTGVFLRYHLEKSSERSPLSDQQSPARTLLYTSVARQKQAGAEKPVGDPEDGRRLTLKRDDLIISGNVVFLFLFFPSAGVSTWGRKGDNGSLICFIYSFR